MANLMEILESSLFVWGLILGLVCLVVGSAWWALLNRDRALPVGGILIAAATMLALGLGGEFSGMALAGLSVLLVLTAGMGAAGGPPIAVAAASVPGAALMALAAPSEPWWFRLVVLLAVPIAGYLSDDFESRYAGLGLGMLFFGLASAGTFLAVPDTELARALIAVAFPIMFLAWPKVKVSLGRSGAYMAIAMFSLATTAGGVGRSAAVVGAMACLGFLILEPLVVRFRPALARLGSHLHHTPEAAVLASLPQMGLVFVAARIAGLLDSILIAASIVAVLFATACLGLLWVERNRIPELSSEPREA